ncbi:MAG: hypothetical protein GX968_07605 [Tissierellia bacterium]|nr:hypothetical protein [Tissierellia bacterium]
MEQKEDKLSIMIIPKTRKVKRITIPHWLPKSILRSILIISAFVFFTFDRKTVIKSSLEEDNVKQEEEIKELELIIQELKDINEKKDTTVAELQQRNKELDNKAREIEIKLEQIDKLKKRLENMAGN